MEAKLCQIVVLISGNGSNLQALINSTHSSPFKIAAVISNKPDALGLERAERENIPTLVIDHTLFDLREEFDNALASAIKDFDPELIVLAGFMRILGNDFVDHFNGRILNIHPSLLPKYPGINTHQRAIDAGDKEHGVSVHFVTANLDGGPIIAREKVSVLNGDTAKILAARVLEKEHIIYPKIVSWFACGRLEMKDDSAMLDGNKLPLRGITIQS